MLFKAVQSHYYLKPQFDYFESEAKRLMDLNLALPAYEMVLKAGHTFNLLDARGAISVTERAAYIARIRTKRCDPGIERRGLEL